MREREGGGEDREGTGLVVSGFVSPGRTWVFTPREVGTLEGCVVPWGAVEDYGNGSRKTPPPVTISFAETLVLSVGT